MMCLKPVPLPSGAVPCGKCAACLLRKRSAWVVRLEEEVKHSSSCYFITLTYSDENVPQGYDDKVGYFNIVSKPDVQNFLKRLRFNTGIKGLKYFLCSEYGPNTLRPHYHFLLFNFPGNLNLFEQIDRAWNKGHIRVDPVSPARIAYVSKYCINESVLPYYLKTKDTKPFLLCSKGIGKSYVTDAALKYHCEGLIDYYVRPGGFKVSLPRYYRDRIFDDAMKEELRERNEERFRKLEDETLQRIIDNLDESALSESIVTQEFADFERRLKNKLKRSGKL